VTTHCKHDESSHSGTRLGDSFTSTLLFRPCPIGLPPLSLSLSNNLCRVSFSNNTQLQNWLDDFFTAKLAGFFKYGIKNLLERLEAIVNNGGEYIIDCLIIYLKNKLFGSVKKLHELMHQPNKFLTPWSRVLLEIQFSSLLLIVIINIQ
jgi:hypothetical protein